MKKEKSFEELVLEYDKALFSTNKWIKYCIPVVIILNILSWIVMLYDYILFQ